MEQGRQYRQQGRVFCFRCLAGNARAQCRCKFVDKRGKLAGVGTPIYFLPTSVVVPGNRCGRDIGVSRAGGTSPCRFRIQTISPSPWTFIHTGGGVWVRCASGTCAGNACFPYGLGPQGGGLEWVNMKAIAFLCSPFVDSILQRILKLKMWRKKDYGEHDLLPLLLDLYGISAALNLRNTCYVLSKDTRLLELTHVATA